MQLHLNPYNTTVGKLTNIKPIQKQITDTRIKTDMKYMNLGLRDVGGVRPMFVTGTYHGEDMIPTFTHPIIVTDNNEITYMVSDLRSAMRKSVTVKPDGSNLKEAVLNKDSSDFTILRNTLSSLWITENHTNRAMMLTDTLPIEVFGKLISNLLGNKLSLLPGHKLDISVVAMTYYLVLTTGTDNPDYAKLAHQISKISRLDKEYVTDVLSRGTLDTLDTKGMLSYMVTVLGLASIPKIDSGILYNLIGTTWYGVGGKDIMPVALEHPPTWITLVQSSITNKNYKNSMLSRTVQVTGNKQRLATFSKAITRAANM